MRKFILAATAIAALAVPAVSLAVPSIASAATGSTTCAAAGVPSSTYDGIPTTDVYGTVNSNLDVPAGAPLCRIFNATINGNLTVEGTVSAFGGHVTGNVTVNAGGQFKNSNSVGFKIDKNLNFQPGVGPDNGFFNTGDSYVGQNLNYLGSTPLFVGYGQLHVAKNATITGGSSSLWGLDVAGSSNIS
jgi:hypothetical protein